jgi:hypothetical protein
MVALGTPLTVILTVSRFWQPVRLSVASSILVWIWLLFAELVAVKRLWLLVEFWMPLLGDQR